jgi:MbtH protein
VPDASDSYLVVINDEKQYSIWASAKPLPAGWRSVGTPDTREKCLAWIDQSRNDMRPASLQRAMKLQVIAPSH